MKPPPPTVQLALAFLAACAGGCKSGNPFTLERLFGPPPAKLVAMAFDVQDPDKRREGIVALSSKSWGLREPHLKDYATILRADKDATVRSAAVRALGKAGDVKYLDHVVRALSDQSATVRWDAALALAGVRGPSAEKPLIDGALNDSSADVRSACAQTLRHYRSGRVVRTLVRCLDDASLAVRFNARASLVKLTGIDMGPDSRAWEIQAEQPLLPAPDAKARPWWDLLGLTRPKPTLPPATTQPAPATAPDGM